MARPTSFAARLGLVGTLSALSIALPAATLHIGPNPVDAAASAAGPHGPEELLPISRMDQALVLYRAVCLAALVERTNFADLALARGLALRSTPAVTASDPNAAAGDLVFATEGEDPIEVSIRGQQRCSVWARATGGVAVKDSFERAVNDMRLQGYPLKWVMDRAVEQKDAPRRLLRAESLLGSAGMRVRFDAALVASEKRSGLQALVVQLDSVAPVAAQPALLVPAASAAAPDPVAPPASEPALR